MAKFFQELTSATKEFIAEQKMFFIASAPDEGRINLSPKGMDSLETKPQRTFNKMGE
jgi:Pyridoxamine 5'-phosphate oxidase